MTSEKKGYQLIFETRCANITRSLAETLRSQNSGTLQFGPEGLTVTTISASESLILLVVIPADNIDEYYCPTPVQAPIKFDHLYDELKQCTKKEIVRWTMHEDKPNIFTVTIINSAEDYTSISDIALLGLDDHQCVFKQRQEFNLWMELPADLFSKIITKHKITGDKIQFLASLDPETKQTYLHCFTRGYLKTNCTKTSKGVISNASPIELFDGKEEEDGWMEKGVPPASCDCQDYFNISTLDPILRAQQMSKNVRIYMSTAGNDKEVSFLLLKYNIGKIGHFYAVIAPCETVEMDDNFVYLRDFENSVSTSSSVQELEGTKIYNNCVEKTKTSLSKTTPSMSTKRSRTQTSQPVAKRRREPEEKDKEETEEEEEEYTPVSPIHELSEEEEEGEEEEYFSHLR